MPEQALLSVHDTVHANAGSSIKFLSDLIGLTRHGEIEVQAAVASALQSMGCSVEHLAYQPSLVPVRDEFAAQSVIAPEERVSVVARLRGTGGGRSLIFFAHPDGEPVRDLSAWERDPFAGTIENGRIYGWGVADDLAGVAGFVEAVAAVARSGRRLAGDVILASTPSKRHARGVFHVLHSGYRADAAVYMHPAESGVGMREIKAVASGLLLFHIAVDGQPPDTREPGHTAFAHRAVNPLDKAMVLIAALQALSAERATRVRHEVIEHAVGQATNILVANLTCGVEGKNARIAPVCSFGASVCFPPGESIASVQGEIEAAIHTATGADPWLKDHPPRLTWLSGVTGAEVPESHALYQVVASAVTRATGHAPHINPLHTSSDIRVPMVQAGIPTVGLGPLGGDLSQNGKHDEWVDVADYLRSIEVAAQIIVDWCGPSQT
jgi:acetylornithine deacetylase